MRDNLAAAFTTWRSQTARATVPDAEREWHAVRRQIRGGVGATRPARPNPAVWFGVPLAAAAALALAFFVAPRWSSGPAAAGAPQTARAYSVEVPGDASTTVFVDEKSGWLIVWADDAAPKSG